MREAVRIVAMADGLSIRAPFTIVWAYWTVFSEILYLAGGWSP